MTNPLRVVQVVDTLALGGAERIVAMLAERLWLRGVDVRVVALRSLSGDPLREPLERAGVPVASLNARGFYDARAWLRLVRFLRRTSASVVHTHLLYADVLGRTAAMAARVPVVSTLHNVPDGFAHHRADRRCLERLTARRLARRLICVSQSAADAFPREWRIPRERVALVPNAIDLGPWLAVREGVPRPEASAEENGAAAPRSSGATAPRTSGAAAHRPPHDEPKEHVSPHEQENHVSILSVGRLNPQKAFDVLLRAARIVSDTRSDVRFTILGRGERATELVRLRDALGLTDTVTFAGEQNDVPSWMQRADVVVSSSAWEGMPLVVIEAMAAGRPVVVTDVGGSREVVGGDDCGVVVPPSDPGALAQAILELAGDSSRRRAMGAAARTRARTAFDIEQLIDAHLAIYDDVLRRRPPHERSTEAVA